MPARVLVLVLGSCEAEETRLRTSVPPPGTSPYDIGNVLHNFAIDASRWNLRQWRRLRGSKERECGGEMGSERARYARCAMFLPVLNQERRPEIKPPRHSRQLSQWSQSLPLPPRELSQNRNPLAMTSIEESCLVHLGPIFCDLQYVLRATCGCPLAGLR
jgi:hypothetical protein